MSEGSLAVTMLFTDVEGSTQLARALGGGWTVVLAAHRRLVREAVAAAGGHVENTVGDSFFATFPNPTAAADAAAAAQRSMRRERWPAKVGELRVRMGVHVGAAVHADGHFVGLEVHRAARIGEAAHGGQVIVSEAARAALGERHVCEDLGFHRLKDFPEPVRLFHLNVDEDRSAAAFPAPRALGPAAALDLLDREKELAVLVGLIDRLVATGEPGVAVIEGEAGIGKTALLHAFVATARTRAGVRVLNARATELEHTVAFSGARQLLAPVVLGADDVDRARMLSGAAAPAGPVLGLAADARGDPVYGLYHLVANLASRGPLVLAIDDVHWLDPDSARFVAYLAEHRQELPLVLTATARPRRRDAGDGLVYVLEGVGTVVRPQPLGAAATATVRGDPARSGHAERPTGGAVEYRLLGPLEAEVDGRPVDLGGPRHRAVLAVLLAHANAVIPAHRLIDDLWGDEPPATAANLVQGAVSHLRKALGQDAIERRGSGYAARVQPGALDLHRFERLAEAGSAALRELRYDEAAAVLDQALALWRGPALADLDDAAALQLLAGRLEELRILVRERRIEADLGRGRHAEMVVELRQLTGEQPLRERWWHLLMLALYRCGRQAEALEAYRSARTMLTEELGIEPGPELQQLEGAILRQDPALMPTADEPSPAMAAPMRSVLVTPLELENADALLTIAEPLARGPQRELILAAVVPDPAAMNDATAYLHQCRASILERGVTARTAAFTSRAPGLDAVRLAGEHSVDLLLLDMPGDSVADDRVVAILEEAPCDVGLVVCRPLRTGPVMVPFGGMQHDWAAIELGAWLASSLGVTLKIAGASVGPDGRDASRLLASASLAVQHGVGVAAEPLLVEPNPEALVEAVAGAGVVVVGLTERWRREGLGPARWALATEAGVPTVLVRRGVRPGGLAPRKDETRFTWTLAVGG